MNAVKFECAKVEWTGSGPRSNRVYDAENKGLKARVWREGFSWKWAVFHEVSGRRTVYGKGSRMEVQTALDAAAAEIATP